MCYLPSSQALFAGQPLLVVACSRKQNSSQGQVAFEFAHDRAIDISQDVSCFELRTVMRLINLIAGFGFWFVSLFYPVAVVGGRGGGQHPHVTLPHLVLFATPYS